MEIRYMKKLQEEKEVITKNLAISNESMSLAEIEEFELIYNNGRQFPRSFREYLFISGKNNGLSIVVVLEDWEMLHEDLEETLDNNRFTIDRPIFPFDKLDGSVFTFFYLDDESEDPKCYILTPPAVEGYHDDEPLIKPAKDFTFSGLINADIERIKNGWRM